MWQIKRQPRKLFDYWNQYIKQISAKESKASWRGLEGKLFSHIFINEMAYSFERLSNTLYRKTNVTQQFFFSKGCTMMIIAYICGFFSRSVSNNGSKVLAISLFNLRSCNCLTLNTRYRNDYFESTHLKR